MFVKIVSDGAQEAIYECERVFINLMQNVPTEGESRSVLLKMEGPVNGGSIITREVIKGHEQVYVCNNLGQAIETYVLADAPIMGKGQDGKWREAV